MARVTSKPCETQQETAKDAPSEATEEGTAPVTNMQLLPPQNPIILVDNKSYHSIVMNEEGSSYSAIYKQECKH